MPERAAGIDDIGHVPFALRGIRPHEWFRRTREYYRWVAFVEQYGSDRVSADGTHTVANANLVVGWIEVRLRTAPRFRSAIRTGGSLLQCRGRVADDHFDATVLPAAIGGFVAGHRVALAFAQ